MEARHQLGIHGFYLINKDSDLYHYACAIYYGHHSDHVDHADHGYTTGYSGYEHDAHVDAQHDADHLVRDSPAEESYPWHSDNHANINVSVPSSKPTSDLPSYKHPSLSASSAELHQFEEPPSSASTFHSVSTFHPDHDTPLVPPSEEPPSVHSDHEMAEPDDHDAKGDALWNQLQAHDASAVKEDYYNTDDGWDVSGMEEDLKIHTSAKETSASAPAGGGESPLVPAGW
jgi:hypothetical protein